jgi:predicted molibdopterin-dependent oxidoreductase YjgC
MIKKVIRLKINGKEIEAEAGMTILECARKNNIFIPSLCMLEGLTAMAGCRLCLVEIKGLPNWVPACQTLIEEGMEVITSSEQLENLRRSVFELILSEHPYFCLLCSEKLSCEDLKITMSKTLEPGGCIFCPKDGECELQKVAEYLNLKTQSYKYEDRGLQPWLKDPFITHNPNLCILCGRCVRVCEEIRGEGILSFLHRGLQTAIGTFFNKTLIQADCSFCGACVDVCPTAAFGEKGLSAAKGKKPERISFFCPLCSSACELEAEIIENGFIRKIIPASEDKPPFMSGCVRGRFGLRELLPASAGNFSQLIEGGKRERQSERKENIEKAAANLQSLKPQEIAFVFSGDFYLTKIIEFLELARALQVSQIFWYYPENFFTRIIQFEKEQLVNIISLSSSWQDLSGFRSFLVLDSDLKDDVPLFWIEVNHILRENSGLILIDSGKNRTSQKARVKIQCGPGREFLVLLSILKLVAEKSGLSFYSGFTHLLGELSQISVDRLAEASGAGVEEMKKAATLLLEQRPAAFIFGERFLRQKVWANNLRALYNLALLLEAKIFPLSSRINELALVKLEENYPLKIISNLGILEKEIEEEKIKVLYVLGDLPLRIKPHFLLVQNKFKTELAASADIFLQDVPLLEEKGYLIDFAGRMKGNLRPGNGTEIFLDEIFNQLASSLEVKINFTQKALLEKIAAFRAKETSAKENENKFLELSEDLKSIRELDLQRKEAASSELLIIIQRNADNYGGMAFPEISAGFRQIRDDCRLWISSEDAERLQLSNGEKIELETEAGNFPAIVKIDYGLKRGVASIQPILNQSFWSEVFPSGVIRGKIYKK